MANFAESQVFELILEGDIEQARKIVADMFPGEKRQVREVLEKYEELLDETN